MSTLGGLGTRDERSSSRGGFTTLVALISAGMLLTGVVLLGRELVTYSNRDFNNLQADVMIAGVQVGGLSESEAQRHWEQVYLDQPVTLIYKNSPILLNPRSLGFITNNQAMLALARSQSQSETNFWSGFWAHLWNRVPGGVNVPLDASLQEGQLRTVLEDIAVRYDSAPGDIGFDLNTLSFQSGASGSRLDIDGSINLIETALRNPDPAGRSVELPTLGVTGGQASMNDLKSAIIEYMESKGMLYDGQTTIASVFVMDLSTGEEMSILGDVAHSAVSTIKIGVMINFFRYQVIAPDPDTAYLLASAIICSHNPGANYTMQVTSDSKQDIIQGLQRADETMLEAGAINSWITSPLWVGPEGSYPVIAPPKRDNLPNPAHNAFPDPLNVSTAEDMGTLLALIYDCAMTGGGLRAIFPEQITQEECVEMIELLSGVKFWRFSELGVPEGVKVAHKVGYGQETVGDVALIYSPATDYIFVMYIWEADLDYDKLTELDKWDMIDETARLVFNYFNPAQPLLERRQPPNPLGGAGCVLPKTSEEINLSDIDQNRFDADGNPVPSACYDWPECRIFDNWGREDNNSLPAPLPTAQGEESPVDSP